MVVHNPPKQHPDFPDMEIYAQEGNQKFIRHKSNKGEHLSEHEHPYWAGKDHS